MPTRLAIAAAGAAVLALSACGSVQLSAGQQDTDGSGQASGTQHGESELRIGSLGAGPGADVGDPGELGLPSGSGASVDDVLRLGAVATWVDAPDELAISLPTTADCFPTAGEPTPVAADRISVTFTAGAVCEAPDAARTYTVQVPAGVDASTGLEVVVEGLPERWTLTLPAS